MLVLIGLIVVLSGACSSEDVAEQIVEGQDGITDVEIDENDGEVSIEFEGDDGESGSVTVGGGDLPDEFPIGVPPGGEVFGVSEAEGTYVIILEYPGDAFASVVAFFDAELANEGFTVSSPFGNTDISASWLGERGSELLNMTAQGGDTVIVSMTYDPGSDG